MKCPKCDEELWAMELSKSVILGPMCMNLKCEVDE